MSCVAHLRSGRPRTARVPRSWAIPRLGSTLLIDCELDDCGSARALAVGGAGVVAWSIGLLEIIGAHRLKNQVPKTWTPEEPTGGSRVTTTRCARRSG